MSDENLTELLERAANRVQVGPAPVTAMVAGASRTRRRRAVGLAVVGAGAAVAVAGATAMLWPMDGSPNPPVAEPEPDLAPPGMRLVGYGQAAIAVPEEWGTNRMECAEPAADTVIIDLMAVALCGAPRPAGVESVEVAEGEPRSGFSADETIEIDGVPAQRKTTTCQPSDGVNICAGAVYIPSMRVYFGAASSTSAADVDRILSQIQVIPDRVGVPGYQATLRTGNDGLTSINGELYLEALGEAGLTAEVRTTNEPPFLEPGRVVDVMPAPGTMLEPGDVVTVTVVGEPESPADEVEAGARWRGPSGGGELNHTQIRAGATVELEVGDQLQAHAFGGPESPEGTLAGELDGDSLSVYDGPDTPNYPNSWIADAPGRTTITLTVTDGGAQYVVGTITVNVT